MPRGPGQAGEGQRVQEPAGTESCHRHGHGHEHGTHGTHGCLSRTGTGSWDGYKDQDGCRYKDQDGCRSTLYQSLVGREHGGISAVPVQGHQRHGPEFLLGEVGGGASAQDHGAQVIVLCTGTGWGHGSCPASPVPAPPSWMARPACTHLSLEDAGGPVPELSLP